MMLLYCRSGLNIFVLNLIIGRVDYVCNVVVVFIVFLSSVLLYSLIFVVLYIVVILSVLNSLFVLFILRVIEFVKFCWVNKRVFVLLVIDLLVKMLMLNFLDRWIRLVKFFVGVGCFIKLILVFCSVVIL